MLLHGAGYMYIDRSGGAIRSLRYVRHDAVSVSMNADPIFKDNPDLDFDGITKLIFTDERFPPLEIADDE